MGEPVSPALAASQTKSASVTDAPLNASTPSIATGTSTVGATYAKKALPRMGDSFEASLGYGGRGCEPLATISQVPGPDGPGAARLAKNLLFAPTHKSYEKMPQTKGHAPSPAELNCKAYLLPVICRDSTKFSRPVVPILRIFSDRVVQLTYVVYGNDAAPGAERYVLYNLDRSHGIALSTNIKLFGPLAKTDGWCKRTLVDHQVKYILAMLSKLNDRGMAFHPPGDWMEMYTVMKKARYLSIGLMVVDGLCEETCRALREGVQESCEGTGEEVAKADLALDYLVDRCNDSHAHRETLYPLLDGALLKLKNRVPKAPAPVPAAPREETSEPPSSSKRPAPPESDDSDSEPLVPPAKKPTPAAAPAKPPAENGAPPAPPPPPAPPAPPKEVEPVHKKKSKKHKEDSEDEEEDEMSGSGSDPGSGSGSEEDEESDEEDDSESDEDEDDSDDDEPKRTAALSKPKPAVPTPGGTMPKSPASDAAVRSQLHPNGQPVAKAPRKSSDKGEKAEKEKRKPARSRRQSMEKTIAGILRQGKGLDDAVPTQNQDKLTARMAEVEKTLRPFVEEGKVVHVNELLHTSWGLISELFTIVNAIGRAGGPAPPDSAVSRKLALTMGRLFDNESKDIEDLSRDLAGWASKMATIVATRAQVALQGDQDSRQLVPLGTGMA